MDKFWRVERREVDYLFHSSIPFLLFSFWQRGITVCSYSCFFPKVISKFAVLYHTPKVNKLLEKWTWGKLITHRHRKEGSFWWWHSMSSGICIHRLQLVVWERMVHDCVCVCAPAQVLGKGKECVGLKGQELGNGRAWLVELQESCQCHLQC